MSTPSAAEGITHLPWFITPPGNVDVLFVVTTIVLLVGIMMIGVLFFWLHHLPEHIGHKKLQFEIVAVLGLISMVTHIQIFWIIGLLLALIDFPDLLSPLRRIAISTEKMADIVQAPDDSTARREVGVAKNRTSGDGYD